jgi:uncharacterized protein (UPF0264 family)
MSEESPSAVRLLVSVRNALEAEIAVGCGADIIDAKEPRRGPLGPVDAQTFAEIVQKVAGKKPISAAGGELLDHAPTQFPGRFTYLKLGLARAHAQPSWPYALEKRYAAYSPARPIAVAYADHMRSGAPPVREVLNWARQHHAAGLLLDTAVKDGAGLFNWLTERELKAIVSVGRKAGVPVALAGSLTGKTFARALALGPDIIGVRGAACPENNRDDTIECFRVRELADLIAAHNARAASRAD